MYMMHFSALEQLLAFHSREICRTQSDKRIQLVRRSNCERFAQSPKAIERYCIAFPCLILSAPSGAAAMWI
jgi:hypothetical protein